MTIKETANTKEIFEEVPFGSNAIRLSLPQWWLVLAILLVLFFIAPALLSRITPFQPEPGYRIPEVLSNDYWLFDRYAQTTAKPENILFLGDSVVWGQYVLPSQTWSAFMNEKMGTDHVQNLGVNGMHPASFEGLIRYYGKSIQNSNILLHCNLLWMSSPEHDLQIEKEFRFNHPQLVTQFYPRIPCYKEDFSNRLGIAAAHHVPILRWSAHLRVAYFNSMDIPSWTIENPYANPFRVISKGIPGMSLEARPNAIPWIEKRISEQDMEWVELDGSIQWRSFQETVRILSSRNNRLLVVIGPFNTHMLTEASRERYQNRLQQVTQWLKQEELPYFEAPLLPSELYADASHPLEAGYRQLAGQVLDSPAYQDMFGS